MYYDTAGVDYVYSTTGQDNDYETFGGETSTRKEVKNNESSLSPSCSGEAKGEDGDGGQEQPVREA